jgi:diaminopimelate epimerase
MVACALIYHELTGEPSPISVLVKGGDTLKVGFEEVDKSEYTNVTLFGPADFVFQGTVQL